MISENREPKISYEGIRIEMVKRKMKWYELQEIIGISKKVTTKINNDEYISLRIIAKIAKEFDCDIGDLVKLEK